MTDSAINWKMVTYTLGGCWLTFVLMLLLLGEKLAVFLNPFPIFAKAVFGILVFGYVGSTGGWNVETIFVYWTLVGLGLSLMLHKIKRHHPAIIALTVVVHVVLLVLTLFPMMLSNGR